MYINEYKTIDSITYKCDDAGSDTRMQIIPDILEESADGIRSIPLVTKLFNNGKIFLVGEVNDAMADSFVAELIHLVSKGKPIDIYINSPGGSVSAGLVIYDIIQAYSEQIEINLYCTGTAASMAAIILAGGKKGHRFILPHSKVMIHEPLIAGGLGGSATTIKKTSDSILETKSIISGILSKHTGKGIKQIDKAISYDNYMNAEEAIRFGICDEIRNIA